MYMWVFECQTSYKDNVPKNYMTIQLVIKFYGSHRIPHIGYLKSKGNLN
jgi:hypothetical protein